MTAPLYVRDGSRFVPLSATLLRDVPPIPVPKRIPDELPEGAERRTAPDGTSYVVRQFGSVPLEVTGSCCPECVYGERA